MRTLPIRLLALIVLTISTLPAVALAQDGGGSDLVTWRLGIPAAVLATVVGLARWIRGRLSDGSLTITATSKAARDMADELDMLRRQNVHLADENADLRQDLEDARQRLQDQLVRAEEREARLFERLINEADTRAETRRSGDYDTTSPGK